jgi:hypothetical protein
MTGQICSARVESGKCEQELSIREQSCLKTSASWVYTGNCPKSFLRFLRYDVVVLSHGATIQIISFLTLAPLEQMLGGAGFPILLRPIGSYDIINSSTGLSGGIFRSSFIGKEPTSCRSPILFLETAPPASPSVLKTRTLLQYRKNTTFAKTPSPTLLPQT